MSARRSLVAAVAALTVGACGGAPAPSAPSSSVAPSPTAGVGVADAGGGGSLREEFERARRGPPAYGRDKQERRELDEIRAMLDLRPRALRDPAMLQKIDEELLRRSRRFMQSHLFDDMRLRDPSAPEVERRYGAWIASNLATWEPALQVVAVGALFAPIPPGRTGPERWPGVDRSALAWNLIDAYRRAPSATRDEDPLFEAATFLLCARDTSGVRRRARCQDEFMQYALETPERRAELARALIERDDPALTAVVMRGVRMVERRDSSFQLELTQALDPAPRAWASAMRELAESDRVLVGDAKSSPDLVAQVREAQRVWVHSAGNLARRGAALYLLASLDRRDLGYVAWSQFAKQFGGAIQPAEFGAFVDVNPARVMRFAHVVLPALATNASPPDAFARAALPALRSYLEASDHERGMRGGEYATMNELLGMLCVRKRQADVRTLGAALAEHEAKLQKKMFGSLPDAWRERDCKAPSVKGPKEEPIALPAPREVPVAPSNKVQLVPTGGAGASQRIDLKPAPPTP